MAEELLLLASSVGDSGLLVVAHHVMGETLLWPGEFSWALEHVDRGIALYRPREHHALASLHDGYHAGVICRSWAAHALWYLGYPDQALRRSREAVALARELAHVHTVAFALAHAAVLHAYRREAQAAREMADAALAFSSEYGFEFWVSFARISRGWAFAEQGQAEDGVAQIRQGLAGYRASGAELERPLWLALLGQACGQANRPDEGLEALAEGLAFTHETGVRFYEAELHRLAGELLLRQAEPDALRAEACFQQALAIAHHQQARSLELRAATSLGYLWRKQGRRHEARAVLQELNNWFTEGFDTADLKAAKALLDNDGDPATG